MLSSSSTVSIQPSTREYLRYHTRHEEWNCSNAFRRDQQESSELLAVTECPCPACGFLSTGESWFGSYNICEVCGWEDDHVQLANPGSGGGANQRSLIETQQRLLRDISQDVIRWGRFVRDVKWRPLRPSEVESALLDTKKDIWMHAGVDKYEQSYWIINPIPRDIQAELKLLKTEEGGRQSPIHSGYRPQFSYNGKDWVVSVNFTGVDIISPGSFYDVFIGFMSPNEHLDSISIGMNFEIREGRRIVGHGMVKRIIDLKFSAIQSQIDIRKTDE